MTDMMHCWRKTTQAPAAATLHSLQNYVVEKQCDIGIATNGDADRIGVIDDKGNFLHPNDILVLLYYYLVKFARAGMDLWCAI